jgi:hypothetical protein
MDPYIFKKTLNTLPCNLFNILISSLQTQRGLVVGIIIPGGCEDKENILGYLAKIQAKQEGEKEVGEIYLNIWGNTDSPPCATAQL